MVGWIRNKKNMVSKTRQQRQKKKAKMAANGGVLPQVIPTPKKSIHEKKTRPHMKGKDKIRLGLESPDIYEGFEDKKGVLWKCQTCGRSSRVVGFCLQCTSGVKAKSHAGLMMSRDGASEELKKQLQKVASGTMPSRAKLATTAKKDKDAGAKKKLRFKKKH
ncbi:Hypothetical protein, putative [Bodo saltans]|uniref:Uncharacterized protein n=1 Tax=Bodo saltans TaxID=75058 RepID=A0A0S4IS54_BODSA|nr:Hypothetical protein, putative [Bodo saltans]|eukprot:CUF19852.1 Hypothetical protein, putative [Bodo saltans]